MPDIVQISKINSIIFGEKYDVNREFGKNGKALHGELSK